MPHRASIYEGVRWSTGTRVTCDGVQLHPPTGHAYDWGTAGQGAYLLARALLADVVGSERGATLAHRFTDEVVAMWGGRTWRTTSDEIRAWADAASSNPDRLIH